MDRDRAQVWLDAYVDAWRTYEPEQIRALFSEDVAYRYHSYDEPVVGADAVVASWLGESDAEGTSSRDAPDTFDAHYAPFAVDGDTVVARGQSMYRLQPGGPVVRVYDNCFLMKFDDEGRCREFTEFYVRVPSHDPD
jgi:SnoaL-like protein